MVCGGFDSITGGVGNPINSCEMNRVGQDTWEPMTALPYKVYGLTSLVINNEVLMIGMGSLRFHQQ